MSAIPSGWGFRDAAALERVMNPSKPVPDRAQARYVRQSELAAYAATLTTTPTLQQVKSHFRCCKKSAYRYLHIVTDLFAKRDMRRTA